MNLKNKKILVTGGKGFIGRSLVQKLIKLGAKVNSFDYSSGQDIKNINHVKEILKEKYSFIYHLAAISGNQKSTKNHKKYYQVNSLGTINLIECVVNYSPNTKVIISSSRLEYGNPRYLPVDEKHPLAPSSPYGLSKLIATQAAQMYAKTKGLKFTVFRTSNVYGPDQAKAFKGYNLVNHFIKVSKGNGTLRIFGEGDQLRDYLYLEDLVDAFVLAVDDRSNGQIYNLGKGEGISLLEMAKLITKTTKNGKIKKIIWPKDWKDIETGSYVSDLSKIKKELGFKPKTTFEDGIKKTVLSI